MTKTFLSPCKAAARTDESDAGVRVESIDETGNLAATSGEMIK